MADNVQLNPGSGGATLRTLRDADGLDWPVGVFAYATALEPGANVVQVVDSTHGMPVAVLGGVAVEQEDETVLNATVHQGGTWTVALAGGATVAVSGTVATTQSGAWSVTAIQSDAASLRATVNQGGSWTVGLSAGATVAATQSGTWNVSQSNAASLKATVNQGGSWTVAATQSGTWNVSQSDAASLKATVSQGGAWTVGLSGGTSVGVSGTVAVTKSGAWSVGLDAGTNLVGKVSAGVDGSTVYNGTAALEPKFVKISAANSGNNAVVAAVADHRIRVLRWGLTAGGDVNAKWRSGSTDLTGARSLTRYASAGGAYCPIGVFQTAKGEALNLNLDAAVAVGGELTYVLVPDVGGPAEPGGGTGAE